MVWVINGIFLLLLLYSIYLLQKFYRENQGHIAKVGVWEAFTKGKMSILLASMYITLCLTLVVVIGFAELTGGDSSKAIDCSSRPADYDRGFAAGQMVSDMGSDCSSCCHSYVQRHNQSANSLINPTPCYCKGFKEGVESRRSK